MHEQEQMGKKEEEKRKKNGPSGCDEYPSRVAREWNVWRVGGVIEHACVKKLGRYHEDSMVHTEI